MLDGLELIDRKCDNKHIRQTFQRKNKTIARGKFFWRSQIVDINWRRARRFISKSGMKYTLLIILLLGLLTWMSPVPFAVVMMKQFHTWFFIVKYLKNFGEILNHTFLVLPALVIPLTLKTSSATMLIQKMALLHTWLPLLSYVQFFYLQT